MLKYLLRARSVKRIDANNRFEEAAEILVVEQPVRVPLLLQVEVNIFE